MICRPGTMLTNSTCVFTTPVCTRIRPATSWREKWMTKRPSLMPTPTRSPSPPCRVSLMPVRRMTRTPLLSSCKWLPPSLHLLLSQKRSPRRPSPSKPASGRALLLKARMVRRALLRPRRLPAPTRSASELQKLQTHPRKNLRSPAVRRRPHRPIFAVYFSIISVFGRYHSQVYAL